MRFIMTAQRTLHNTTQDQREQRFSLAFPRFRLARPISLAQDTGWLKRGENLLSFGTSGVGKTHLAAAIARSLVELGAKVKFTTATALLQLLQQAKAQFQLQALLLRLDRYDLLVVDDIGYVKKSESETSVLFELQQISGN